MERHIAAFQEEYQRIIGQIPLPGVVADAYEIIDCLHETRDKATYLARSRQDHRLYVLKTVSAACKEDIEAEYSLLAGLSHPAIPRAVMYLEQDGERYMIREYIKGITLAKLVEDDGPLPEREAAGIVMDLCAVLTYMHTRRPPVIHRDIKPLNIILTPHHQCAMIDFGIARHFHDDGNKDTVFMGTEATAAPEQFGYKQTDARSDVYAVGILLLYLLTGSFDIQKLPDIHSKGLQRIITNCTRFDPTDRYPSVSRLHKSLVRTYSEKRLFIQLAFLCGLLVGLAFGLPGSAINSFATGMSSTQSPVVPITAEAAPQPVGAYTFASPLIEKAVRQELGLDENAVITEEDLGRVTKILICGDTVYREWTEHTISGTDQYLNGASEKSTGTVDTLMDIAKMTNLKELALNNQRISDIAPLQGLPLTKLGLAGNQVSNISALAACSNITDLLLTGNPITDIEPLSGLSKLRFLDLADTDVTDITPLDSHPIFFISLIDTPVQDYTVLTRLPDLNWLRVSDMPPGEAEICGELHGLVDLTMYRCSVSDLNILQELTELLYLDLLGNQLTDISKIGNFSKLQGLCIQGNPITELSPLTQLSDLHYINLIDIDEAEYTPLAKLPSLQTVDCSEGQRETISVILGDTDVVLNFH